MAGLFSMGPRKGPARPPGWQGIAGLLAHLSGLNANQIARMRAGRAPGHEGGAFQGLSQRALQYIANSGLLDQRTPDMIDTSGLEGADLFRAQLQNNLAQMNAQVNPMYDLHSGVDADFLTQLFSQGFGGQGAYRNGYNASGILPNLHPQQHPHHTGAAGYSAQHGGDMIRPGRGHRRHRRH